MTRSQKDGVNEEKKRNLGDWNKLTQRCKEEEEELL